MKLLRLTLRNFKGVRSFEIAPSGADLSIYGDNAAGKTTLADAWFWLLFDKDSSNRKDFEIKTLDLNGEPLHGLEHEVEAELEIDGKKLTLRKVYKEDYTKPRGKAEAKYSGNENLYWINSVPVRKTDFNAKIASIAPEKTFRLLTDPLYFNTQLEWKERRRMLLEICGDVSDAAVIASSDELREIPIILGDHTVDDYRKILDAKRKAVQEELKTLPVRIDEAQRAMTADEPAKPAGTVEALRQTLSELEQRKVVALAGGEVAEETKKLRTLEGELQQIANEIRQGLSAGRNEALNKRADLERRGREIDTQLSELDRRIRSAMSDRDALQPRIIRLRQEYKAESAKAFAGEDSCPACGQALPAEQVAAATEAFNGAKAKKLEEIIGQGKALAGQVEEFDSSIAKWQEQAEALKAEKTKLASEARAISVPESETIDLGADPGYTSKGLEIESVKFVIANLQQGSQTAIYDLDQQIHDARSKVGQAEQWDAWKRQQASGAQRIKELGERRAVLSADYESVEQEIYLCELFVRTKVSLLTDRINSRFSIATFKLFEEQINGGLAETCETCVGGVPYGSLNHGARLNCGLDILNTLAEHQGFAPPVFIDNAESVTSILPTQGQQIRLVVSAPDKTLRVETSGAPAAKELTLV